MQPPYLQRPQGTIREAGPSSGGFYVRLYLEHLSEASFLYEQRLALLDDPELAWPELDDFEQRLEAHIDALVLGEELALDLCRQRAVEGDVGECHTALRVACRLRRWDVFADALAAIEGDDDERWTAVRDALCYERPAEWAEELGRLAGAGGRAAAVAAEVIGHRRLPAGPALLTALETGLDNTVSFVWALGRLRHRPALSALLGGPLRDEDPTVRMEAALSCLRIGEPNVVNFVLSQPGAWPARVAALGGGPTAARRLLERLAAGAPDAETILALGLLGDPASVSALLYHLRDEAMAEPAALGLHLLTGAALYEEVETPVAEESEPSDDDEDAPAGEVEPAAPLPTVKQRRVVRDVEVWTAWWEEHRTDFGDATRFRFGEPATPKTLVAALRSEILPRFIRQLAADELAVRYGCEVPFETDLFVRDQFGAIALIEEWAGDMSFQAGAWYLGGRRLTV